MMNASFKERHILYKVHFLLLKCNLSVNFILFANAIILDYYAFAVIFHVKYFIAIP